MELLYSEKELEKFLAFFYLYSPLTKTEKYFISMACRRKYLTHPEEYSTHGTSEMFERKLIAADILSFKKVLTRYNSVAQSYTDKNGKVLPEEGFAVYLNINPSDLIKTYYDFTNKINVLLKQITIETMQGKDCDRLITEFMPLESNLHTAMQKSRLHKNLIDIDIDTKELFVVEGLHQEYVDHDVIHQCIETRGGYHILLVKDTLKYNFHGSLVAMEYRIEKELGIEKEVCINVKEMIPLPGTIQGGFPVKVIDEYSKERGI
jgi:hypothetical protein